MKNLTILLILFPIWLNAQNISVKSFKLLERDLDARVVEPKKDQNGDKCAIIKIVTTEKGFVFDGDMNGIVTTVYKTGEYWVYLPWGSKKITIKHEKLGILRNYLYPIPIKEATVYEMVLTTGTVVTTVVEQEIKTAYLIIKSKPEGGDVYIDETYLGVTPFNKKMTAGSYNYRVEVPMYHNSVGKIEITGDNPREELNLTLKPAFGYAKITTTPENGATVIIDGENAGQKTPMTTKKLKNGTHRVTVKMPMYQPVTKDFTVTEGQTSDLNIELKPSFANVTINTSPAADIYIDAEKVGTGTYTGRVLEGFHSYEARKEKYTKAKEQLELEAGVSKIINLSLQPKLGKLEIATTPMDATIKLNDVEKGKTPNTIKGLLIGDYKLSLQKKGFTTITKTISITENKTTQLNETLISTKKAGAKTPVADKQQKNKIKEDKTKPVPAYSTKAAGYHKTKNIFFIISGVSAGVGGYFMFSANSLYKEYQDATNNASDLHKQIQTQDIIWKTSFGVGAASLATALFFGSKEKKAKRNIRAAIIPVKDGAGINLVYKF